MTPDEIAFLQLLNRWCGPDGNTVPQAAMPPSNRVLDKARQACRKAGLAEFSTYSRPAGWRITEAGRDVLAGLAGTWVAQKPENAVSGQIWGRGIDFTGGGEVRFQTMEEGR